jgi:hypothetical protein
MKPRVQIVWLNEKGNYETGSAVFSNTQAENTFDVLANAICEIGRQLRCTAHCELEEVSSEDAMIEFLDSETINDISQARETLFWLLLPTREGSGRQYVGPAEIDSMVSLLLPRLVTRYPLSWLVFHFLESEQASRVERMIGPAYLEEANGGSSTQSRLKLACQWHFSFGVPSALSVKTSVEFFLLGLRQWFDPVGFRGAMLGMLKARPVLTATSKNSGPRTARESRRVFLAAAIDEEPTFALCVAYAAYRAGMGSIAVSTERLFGSDERSPLAEIARLCANSPRYPTPDSVLILRDLDLQFGDTADDSNYEDLEKWPRPLREFIWEDMGVVVRVISAIHRQLRTTPPEEWQGFEKRVGVSHVEGVGVTYVGLSKPLKSFLIAPKLSGDTIPFLKQLISVTQGRFEANGENRERLYHTAPRRLQDNIRFLGELAVKLSQAVGVEDLISAALLELVRLEALRGAGPLLIAQSLEHVYMLEARIEIAAPYFDAKPDLSERVKELEECLRDVARQGRLGIQTHLVKQILGKLKVVYRSNGVFGAADRVQRELLRRSSPFGEVGRSYLAEACALNPKLESLALQVIRVWRRVAGMGLSAFFNPLWCVLVWLAFDCLTFALARLFDLLPREGDFAYMALTGNMPRGFPGAFREEFFVDSVVFGNICFLAVFTASLFRWFTRD